MSENLTNGDLDPRVVIVTITSDGVATQYEGLAIEAKGIKTSDTVMNQCELTMLNLASEERERILKETNPFFAKGKVISVTVEAGRESYGTTLLYKGRLFRSRATPKPNLGVAIKCIQGYDNRAKIVSRSETAITDGWLRIMVMLCRSRSQIKKSLDTHLQVQHKRLYLN